MNSRKFAAACVGAALSLAVASFWASAADYTPMKPLQPPPAPPPPLDIHGFFDDGALTGSAVTINAYVKLFYAISGSSTVVVGNQGNTYDVEIGMVPTLDLKKITGTPLTIAAPTWVTVGPSSYWNGGASAAVRSTGCGPTTTIEPCSLSNAAVVTTGLALKAPLDWLIPPRWGTLHRHGSLHHYHIINDSL